MWNLTLDNKYVQKGPKPINMPTAFGIVQKSEVRRTLLPVSPFGNIGYAIKLVYKNMYAHVRGNHTYTVCVSLQFLADFNLVS